MASFIIALSKPQLLKRIFCNNFPKPFYHFSSSANEHNPDPNPHHLTHSSQPDSYKSDHYKKVETLCKDQRFNDAKQLIYNLAQKGIHKNEDLFILLIDQYAKHTEEYNAYQNSVRIFKTMDKLGVSKTVKSYNHLFRVILSVDMSTRADKFFRKMLDQGVDPDMDTYRIMTSGYVYYANKFFEHMKSRNILPDIVIYNNMVNGYVREKRMDEAEKIIVEMKGVNVEPDLDTYNSMIDGYAQVRRMEDVERLVAEMKGENIEPDLVTYNLMVDGYAQIMKMEDVERLVVEMKGRNIEPDLVTYNAMMDGYYLVEKMEGAEKVVVDMKERGIELDLFTYVTLIKGYVKADRVDDGLELIEEMKGKWFGRNIEFRSYLNLLKMKNISENQRSVLRGVKDYVGLLESWAIRDAARELSDLASCQVVHETDI
ncbi:pentatricopeptide repeat protein [Artemisia annua]|uniref:Pentatricopeptide repeat protein n=1 Tax=Artemisia annua TaxID=35608 RepID=A0A2U1NHX4_ARTAN|nr:pentatricopeptide repeat protein [Artemisia annua]